MWTTADFACLSTFHFTGFVFISDNKCLCLLLQKQVVFHISSLICSFTTTTFVVLGFTVFSAMMSYWLSLCLSCNMCHSLSMEWYACINSTKKYSICLRKKVLTMIRITCNWHISMAPWGQPEVNLRVTSGHPEGSFGFFCKSSGIGFSHACHA